MKAAIQGLGEVPTTVELVLKEERPDVMYILCSDYQLKHVASDVGRSQPNETVVKAAAREAGAKLVIKKCDVFDPSSVGEALGGILEEIRDADEIIVNYSGGSAIVKLILGMVGVVLSRLVRTKIVYAIEYPEGVRVVEDHTEPLREVYRRLYEFV